MSEVNVNNASFSISLNPPGSEGDPFSNNVTYAGGKPLGEGFTDPTNQMLTGFLGSDSLSSASEENIDQLKALLAGLNVGVLLAYNSLPPEQQLQLQIDNLDPSNPAAPIILIYVKIADESLKSGDLPGVSVGHVAKSEAQTDEIEASASTSPTTETGGTEAAGVVQKKTNPWLSGNAYTQFVTSFYELLSTLKEMKEIDSRLELEGMAQVYDLAHQTADTIMAAAKERAMMHIVQAVIAGVSMGFTIVATAASVYQTGKFQVEEQGDLKTGKGAFDSDGKEMTAAQAAHDNKQLTWGAKGTSTIQSGYIGAVTLGAKAMDSAVQAIFEVRAAAEDAMKELLQMYRTIAQQQTDRATEGFKSYTDLINQILQSLDQIRQKLTDAISANMRKG